MRKIIIAIDGYSGCGKSTTAKLVASSLEYSYIDTGAMYRAATLYFLDNHIKITNPKEVEEALKKITIDFRFNEHTNNSDTYLNGLNVEKEIRKMKVSEMVSPVSAISSVRKKMTEQQVKMGKNKAVVMDGRDIGTNVFPDAELKIFMVAEIVTRAKRRQQELLERGQVVGLDKIIHNLEERDRIDTSREESPLRQADDAILVDTTYTTIEEQVQIILEKYEECLNNT